MPNNYMDGTVLYPFIDWCATTADAGNVRLSLVYSYQFDTDGSLSSAQSQTIVQAVNGDAVVVARSTDWVDVAAPSGVARNGIMLCQVIRDGGHATDTYPSDICILGAGFKYRAVTIGHERAF